MTRKNIHTVYNAERARWENKQEGTAQPLSSHQTKDNAVTRGQGLARESHAEHLIHGKNGQIQERNSYGNDPFPPRG